MTSRDQKKYQKFYIQIFELETKAQLSEKPSKRFRAQQNLILGKKADGLLLEKAPNLVKISTLSQFSRKRRVLSISGKKYVLTELHSSEIAGFVLPWPIQLG